MMKRNEGKLRHCWDIIKCTKICIIRVPERDERVPGRINSKRSTPRYIVIKLTKIKDDDKILKGTREKRRITYQGTPIRLSADFSTETLQARREWKDTFKVLNRKKLQPRILYQQDFHSDLMEKSKAFQTSKSEENSAPSNKLSFFFLIGG